LNRLEIAGILAGLAFIVVGIALVYPPLAFIAIGAILLTSSLDIDLRRRQ
jgi:hypothetical protein